MDLAYNKKTKEISMQHVSLAPISIDQVARDLFWNPADIALTQVDDARLDELQTYDRGSVNIQETRNPDTDELLREKVLADFEKVITDPEKDLELTRTLTDRQKQLLNIMRTNNPELLEFLKEFDILPNNIERVADNLP
mgnify:CR=1 FL=1